MSPIAPGGLGRIDDRYRPSGGATVSLATARLLWAATRRSADPAVVLHALATGADLRWAASAALEHRIAALLWRALCAADVRAEAQRPLATYSRILRAEALLLHPRAVSLAVGPLVDAGMEPVVMKGPAVAARYPAPGLRPMEDIDLLLPFHQHAAALATLASAGWKVVRAAARDHYDSVLQHPEIPWLTLELHYGFEAPHERVTALDPDRMWARRIPIDCLGTPAFGLSLADELVVLAVHAGKPFHGFERLIWIADLAMIVGAAEADGSSVDWEEVRRVADEGQCRTRVGAALALAHYAGVDAAPELVELPASGWRGEALAPLVDLEWPLRRGEISTFHLRYALTDSRRFRAKLLAGIGHGLSSWQRVRSWSTIPWSTARRWVALRSVLPQDADPKRRSEAFEPPCRQSRLESDRSGSKEGTPGGPPPESSRMTA